MNRIQISTSVSEKTRQQADWLITQYSYTLRDVITLAIDNFYWKSINDKQMQSIDSFEEFINNGGVPEDAAAFELFLQKKSESISEPVLG